MKVLMIGLGSIGQRHVRNMRKLFNDIEFIAYRKRGLNLTFSDDLKVREGLDLQTEYNIKTFNTFETALEQKPNVAFITNITSEHVQSAMKAAEYGCDLFIEKPLSSNLKDIEHLKEIIEQKKLMAFMGYQMRYHPGLQRLKEIISFPAIGNILSIDIEASERLPTIHSYEDYRTMYMSRKDYGGGVVLSILIHELDYLRWIFGDTAAVYANGGKLSNLEIDVEDICEAVFSIKAKGRTILVRVHADYLQYPASRYCKVVCDNGKVCLDFVNNKLEWSVQNEIKEESFTNLVRNDLFIAELKDFFDAIEKRTEPKISIEDGIASLKMALAIKKSMETGERVFL
jgi:predicted dehydrogenase